LRRPAIVFACAALALFGIAGCGEEETTSNVSETETLGPASAEGDIEPSAATLRAEDGFSTLVSTQITTRGNVDTLVAGQIELEGSAQPRFRFKIDGKVAKGTHVEVSEDEGNRVAVVSCACQLKTGDHDVVLEGAAKSSTERVGAKTLVVFDDVGLDEPGSQPISGSDLVTDQTQVISEGADLAKTSTHGDGGPGPLLVIALAASPRTGTGSENVRLEVEIGGEVSDELAKTTIPTGKLVAYLDGDGAGEDVTLRGYTTAGRTEVGVASLLTCNCGISR
jgi:hypothetical protein